MNNEKRTDIGTLANADWEKIERQVLRRIEILKSTARNLPPHVVHDKIANDLMLPAIMLLGEFCACVEIEDEETLKSNWVVLFHGVDAWEYHPNATEAEARAAAECDRRHLNYGRSGYTLVPVNSKPTKKL